MRIAHSNFGNSLAFQFGLFLTGYCLSKHLVGRSVTLTIFFLIFRPKTMSSYLPERWNARQAFQMTQTCMGHCRTKNVVNLIQFVEPPLFQGSHEAVLPISPSKCYPLLWAHVCTCWLGSSPLRHQTHSKSCVCIISDLPWGSLPN